MKSQAAAALGANEPFGTPLPKRAKPLVAAQPIWMVTLLGALALSGAGMLSCAPVTQQQAQWPGQSQQWHDRARASLAALDLDDAENAVERALQAHPTSPQVRVLAAEIAIAQLDYQRVLELLADVSDVTAAGLRGRALWYLGRLSEAADELEVLLADPAQRDPWAEQVVKLARQGGGRTPFRITGGLLAVSEMPHAGTDSLIVPLELNGEPALGMIDTSRPEAVVDSSSGRDPAWVSLRFGGTVEVKDVPAFKADLSGLSREVNAPIRVLLGVHLLRRLNATFDFRGSQFVVRTFTPPAPPHATTLKLAYVRGEFMATQGSLGEGEPPSALLINTGLKYPIALDTAGWKRAGVNAETLQPVPGLAGMKSGSLPQLTVGAFSIPDVPGVLGAPLENDATRPVQWDAVLGAGLFAAFRVTLVDEGRTLWLEDIGYGYGGPPVETREPAPGEPEAEGTPLQLDYPQP